LTILSLRNARFKAVFLDDDDDDDVYLIKITTWQWVTKSISILIWNQPEKHKYKMKSIRKIFMTRNI
jgi:hypothetical protein